MRKVGPGLRILILAVCVLALRINLRGTKPLQTAAFLGTSAPSPARGLPLKGQESPFSKVRKGPFSSCRQHGILCVGGPGIVRLHPVLFLDSSGAGSRVLDFAAPPSAQARTQSSPA